MIAFFDIRAEEKPLFTDAFGDEHEYCDGQAHLEEVTAAEDVDTLCVFVKSEVTREVIDVYPHLKHIATRSTGTDHIDVEYAKEKGVAVSRVPGYGEQTVAEFAFALLLTLSRKIFDAYHQVREQGDYSFTHLRGFDLYKKTFGVVGTGRIGAHAARIARGFGMDVIAYDVHPDRKLAEDVGFTYSETLEDLLERADVVSLHVPYLPTTHHMFNADTIPKMKRGAYLINTARGELVDTTELIRALKSGAIAGAGLDVLEGERDLKEEAELVMGDCKEVDVQTLLEGHVLIDMPNVVVTPHIAFYTKEAEREIIDTTIENIKQFNETGEPVHVR